MIQKDFTSQEMSPESSPEDSQGGRKDPPEPPKGTTVWLLKAALGGAGLSRMTWELPQAGTQPLPTVVSPRCQAHAQHSTGIS